MPSATEIANHAVELAHRASDELATYIATASDEEIEKAGQLVGSSASDDVDAHRHLRRETWERFAGLQLLLASGCIRSPEIEAEDDADAARLRKYQGWDALSRGDLAEASFVAESLLEEAASLSREDWNYGNLVHDGHVLLGYVRLRDGDVAGAEAELRAAAETPGSPQLNSFGPDLSLAWELLRLGRDETVIVYLRGVARSWSPRRPDHKVNPSM